MNDVGKDWGRTAVKLKTPTVQVHRIMIRPHMQCSLHCHEHRWNAFIVLSGKLTIETEGKPDEFSTVDLLPGDFHTVAPNVYHRFRTDDEPADVFEIYYPEALSDEDIIRKTRGGPVGSPQPSRFDDLGNPERGKSRG